MVLELGIAKDYALLPEVGDSEEHPFRVDLVMEDYIYYFGDLTYFVRGAVHVVHQYRAGNALGANTLHTDKVFIYEAARSSGVQKHLDKIHLAGVSSTDLYRKDDRHSASVKGIGRELSG